MQPMLVCNVHTLFKNNLATISFIELYIKFVKQYAFFNENYRIFHPNDAEELAVCFICIN